jgi:hypothetical protein
MFGMKDSTPLVRVGAIDRIALRGMSDSQIELRLMSDPKLPLLRWYDDQRRVYVFFQETAHSCAVLQETER